MDHFGIGAAMKSMAQIYSHSARRTGRTTAFMNSLKDGDRIVCAQGREAERLRRLCQERSLNVTVLAISPKDPGALFQHGTSKGRTLFEHTWVEQYFQLVIEGAVDRIDVLQRESSGRGLQHEQTRQQSEAIARWTI